MGFERFDWSLVFVCFWGSCGPDVDFAIFAAAYHIPSIIAERCMYLTARVFVAFEFNFQAFVSEIIYAYSRVVTGNQKLDFAVRIVRWIVYCLYPGDFASFCIFAMR